MFLNISDHIPPVESILNSTPSFKVSQIQHNLVNNPETKKDFQLALQNIHFLHLSALMPILQENLSLAGSLKCHLSHYLHKLIRETVLVNIF